MSEEKNLEVTPEAAAQEPVETMEDYAQELEASYAALDQKRVEEAEDDSKEGEQWAQFAQMMEDKTIVKVKISEAVKGGVVAYVDGVRAFIPASQLSTSYVEKLEEGIQTQVRERGQRFSEGQKQRLSIARALLADAPIMILDEATSALDVATERRVLRSIIKKEPHRTLIVAAHRPSVFSMCSRVYKIQEHTVLEVDEDGIRQFLNDF